MKYFCLPSDFKYETLDRYHEINQTYEEGKVMETYGQLSVDNPFGSCRFSGNLPQIDRNQLEKYIKYGEDKGIGFNYVINATCMSNEELTGEGFKKIREFLQMLESIGVNWLTMSLPSLMEITHYVAPKLNIKASTVCQINSPHKAKFYEDMGVRRLVLDEDIYRKFDVLQNIRKIYTGELEVIVNSFCLSDCPYKMFHYNSLSHSHITDEQCSYYTSRCKATHIGAENFMKINWIRPEDLYFYSDMGINFFKLQGRTNVYSGDPARALVSYMEGHYEGNLLSLLELFSPKKPLTIANAEVDNRKLDHFLDRFVHHPALCTKLCSECGYCKAFAEKSIDSSSMAVMDLMNMMKDVYLDLPLQKLGKG